MSDTGFREIQLSGKHVVFLFMAGAVAAIAIFLLGVSVGRGAVKPDAGADPAASPAPVAETDASQALPPATLPARGELQYQAILQGKTDPQAATPSPSPSTSPAASSMPDPAPARPAAPPPPSASPAATPATPAPKAAVAGSWYVQIDSFNDRDNAMRRIAQLKTKGFVASLHVASGAAPYKVRMGPYDEAFAATMMARLRKEGYSPSRTR